MKPVDRRVLNSSNFLRGDFNSNFGVSNTVASIQGSVKKLGINYQNTKVILYSKIDLLPYAAAQPGRDGNYKFLGLNRDLKTFIVAFDKDQQFNAVIQDNVVPK